MFDLSSPDIGATLKDLVLAKVKSSPGGLKRSELTRDERSVATFLVNDGKLKKQIIDPKTYSVLFYQDDTRTSA